jgi:hypothetical protein
MGDYSTSKQVSKEYGVGLATLKCLKELPRFEPRELQQQLNELKTWPPESFLDKLKVIKLRRIQIYNGPYWLKVLSLMINSN